MMSTLRDYPINTINTGEALSLFQYYLQEVAEYQYILELLINNLTSLITQLHDL